MYVLEKAGTSRAIFRWGLANESGRAIWNELSEENELGPSDVQRATGLSISTIQKALKRMVDLGIVYRPSHGRYLRCSPESLETAAEEFGADIQAKNQRDLYQNQRSGFGWFQLRRLATRYARPELLREWTVLDSYRVLNWSSGQTLTLEELERMLWAGQ